MVRTEAKHERHPEDRSDERVRPKYGPGSLAWRAELTPLCHERRRSDRDTGGESEGADGSLPDEGGLNAGGNLESDKHDQSQDKGAVWLLLAQPCTP